MINANLAVDFPLVDSSYDNAEILSCISTLLSGHLTMGVQVRTFEQEFAKQIGSPYAVMVNSGSSANLLALSAITNPARTLHLKPGDKVGIPAVCWSTSLWPIVQAGLVPVFLDVDPCTLNLSVESLRDSLRIHDLRGLMLVHVLGNGTDMKEVLDIAEQRNILLIEDTCESLGSVYNDRALGTIGSFGTFSFYFSHHMTTIEGGMILASTEEDYELLKCLRAHGWSREQKNKKAIEAAHSHIDPRFLFINSGYNLRPMEIQAAFGLEQLKRLSSMNDNRRTNVEHLRSAFLAHPSWQDQISFPDASPGLTPCWFGFPFLVNDPLKFDIKSFKLALTERGIDTRPIVSGNMALQPAIKLFNIDCSMGPFVGAQKVHDQGLFIGCHSTPLGPSIIDALVSAIIESLQMCLR
jgi:CDP-6-deoxy-D-xylo-4-hexulose-3-dehydrase